MPRRGTAGSCGSFMFSFYFWDRFSVYSLLLSWSCLCRSGCLEVGEIHLPLPSELYHHTQLSWNSLGGPGWPWTKRSVCLSPRAGIKGTTTVYTFSFLRNLHTGFHSGSNPLPTVMGPVSPHPCHHCFLNSSYFNWSKMESQVSVFHFLMSKWCWALKRKSICILSLESASSAP